MVAEIEASVDPDSVLRDRNVVLGLHGPLTIFRHIGRRICAHCVRCRNFRETSKHPSGRTDKIQNQVSWRIHASARNDNTPHLFVRALHVLV